MRTHRKRTARKSTEKCCVAKTESKSRLRRIDDPKCKTHISNDSVVRIDASSCAKYVADQKEHPYRRSQCLLSVFQPIPRHRAGGNSFGFKQKQNPLYQRYF